ncbi:MAG: redoxin domain-containing protein [Flavobacteriales bacterium]|nr:redoxin domain-containing protein [Flavobacteriales bacterium]
MTVSGNLENAAGQEVSLQVFDGSSPASTAVVGSDGSFALDLQNPSLDYFKLSVGGGDPVVLIFDSTHTDIHIEGDADDFIRTYSVSGSPDSEVMKEFFVLTERFQHDLDSVKGLSKSLPTNTDPMIRIALSQEEGKMTRAFEKELKELAMENLDSPAALSIISAVDIRGALTEYKKVSSAMKEVIPSSPYLTSLNSKIQQMEQALAQQKQQEQAMAKLKSGEPAPEIDLQDPDGKFVSLSSLKGKYVLIDFWASWCGPCRRENPNVVKLYEKYGGDRFEILGVSLDSSKDRWLKAIEKDGLDWLHVSDLKKWNSVAAADYGVRSIPFTVLVDPDGNVVATKLRGKALEDKLAEIFGSA